MLYNTLRRHFYLIGLTNSPYVEGAGQRKKSQPTFMRVQLWLHSDIHIWAPSSLDPEDVKESKSGGNLELW
jgi:hypothetical protein